MATIFKKTSARPLSDYQKRMNEASQYLCLRNPGLLRSRQQMMEEARKKVLDDGFQFAKGKSRSKKIVNTSSDHDISKPESKRQKMNQGMRENRLKELDETINDLSERISFKEKRITACLNVSDFKACDEIKDSVIELKVKRRELEAELKRLMASTRKSKWYFKRKATDASASSGKSQRCSSTSSDMQSPSPSTVDSSYELSSSGEQSKRSVQTQSLYLPQNKVIVNDLVRSSSPVSVDDTSPSLPDCIFMHDDSSDECTPPPLATDGILPLSSQSSVLPTDSNSGLSHPF